MQARELIPCANCGTLFQPRSFVHSFCSAKCRRQARGAAWGWVREAAVERDGHACQGDGCTATTGLQVHHIIPVCRGGESTLENVTTLCAPCHRAIHRSWAAWKDRGLESERRRNGRTRKGGTRGARAA